MGAVSMFTGVDIAAAVKKRADSLSPEGKQEKGKTQEISPWVISSDKVKF